jgi:hypothetical protein
MVMEWLGHRDSDMIRYSFHLDDRESQHPMKRISFAGVDGSDVAAGPAPEVLEAPHAGQQNVSVPR